MEGAMKRIVIAAAAVAWAANVWAESVRWESNYDDALRKAKQEKKLVMVDVYTDWCGWCKKLDRDVYTDRQVVEKLNKNFIAVKINPERSATGKKLAKEFGVRGYPNIIFLDATGKKLHQQPGYRPAPAFCEVLDEVVRKAGQ